MQIQTRAARLEDAPFVAWVIQEAARSHLPKGVWDLAFPGDEAQRLQVLEILASTDCIHFCHFSRFRVLEVDAEPVAALSAYENAAHGTKSLELAMLETFGKLGWTPKEMVALGERIKAFDTTGYPNADGLWIVEWVATRPTFRGRGLIRRLLDEILQIGRNEGFTRSQIGYMLGNDPAVRAYEKVGFEWVEDHRSLLFEAALGSPGLGRMRTAL